MKFAGIELHNFRSIGQEPVVLRPWRKCNVLVGQNNAGKSNVTRAVDQIVRSFRGSAQQLGALDLHSRSIENKFALTSHRS